MVKLKEQLRLGRTLLADGAMGTALQNHGLEAGGCGEEWNLSHPAEVTAVAESYSKAGSDLVYTNTFGANRVRLSRYGLGERIAAVNTSAVEAAGRGAGEGVYVVGSIGPTGELLEPLGSLTEKEAFDAFVEQAQALVDAGVDGIVVETFSALEEVGQAVQAVKQVARDLPLLASMSFESGGRTMMGVAPEDAVRFLKEAGADVVGANCSVGPDTVSDVIQTMHEVDPSVPLLAKANAGIPEWQGDRSVYPISPEQMGAFAERVSAMGALIVGGCCGTTPAHIAAMAQSLSR